MNTLLSNNDYVIPEAIPGVPDLQASLGASPLHDNQHMSGKVTLHHQADTCLAKKKSPTSHCAEQGVCSQQASSLKAPPFSRQVIDVVSRGRPLMMA